MSNLFIVATLSILIAFHRSAAQNAASEISSILLGGSLWDFKDEVGDLLPGIEGSGLILSNEESLIMGAEYELLWIAEENNENLEVSGLDVISTASCNLLPEPGSGILGSIMFVEKHGKVTVDANIKGLSAGKHGIHIYESRDYIEGCKSGGPHYNPFKKKHGGPFDQERHVDDMGNVESYGYYTTFFHYVDPIIRLTGKYSVIGRLVVLHSDEDDLGKGEFEDSMTNGHSGAPLACCEIYLEY